VLAEGRVAYLGVAKDAVPFFNQYVVDSWSYLLLICFESSLYSPIVIISAVCHHLFTFYTHALTVFVRNFSVASLF